MKTTPISWLLIASCLALPHVDLFSQGLTERKERDSARDELEDRLLEAELLEVSAGDLDKAMTIYKALVDMSDTPESTRARALLYLARCHRKLGQIDQAKALLSSLVKTHAQEKDVLRQARAFLRELQGENRNPEFDWLSELGKNPEIQARVFDLVMDLVDLGSDTGRRARRQLLALGTVGVPVLEKMVTTSRDNQHRRHLALLLIKLGRVEYWKVLLDPQSPLSPQLSRVGGDGIMGSDLSAYFRSIPSLSDAERQRLLKIIDAVPEDAATAPYRELIRFRAGVLRDFAKAIPHLEVFVNWHHDGHDNIIRENFDYDLRSLLGERVENDLVAARALAERLLAPECRSRETY